MDKIMRHMNRMIEYALEHPETAPSKILIMDIETVSRILTPARAELLKVITEKKPKTVGELVREVGRPEESVSRDLRILQNYGFISFEKSGRQKTPKIDKEVITMTMTA